MEIIISANEIVLSMSRESGRLSEDMTEQEYTQWLNDISEGEIEDGHEV